jgi:hypothetical protein
MFSELYLADSRDLYREPLQPQSRGYLLLGLKSSLREDKGQQPGWTACFETAARPLTPLRCSQYCLAQPTLPQSDSVAPLGGVLKITSVSNSILSLPPAKTLFCGHRRGETVKQTFNCTFVIHSRCKRPSRGPAWPDNQIAAQHQEWNSNYDNVGQQEKQLMEPSREMPESTKGRREVPSHLSSGAICSWRSAVFHCNAARWCLCTLQEDRTMIIRYGGTP